MVPPDPVVIIAVQFEADPQRDRLNHDRAAPQNQPNRQRLIDDQAHPERSGISFARRKLAIALNRTGLDCLRYLNILRNVGPSNQHDAEDGNYGYEPCSVEFLGDKPEQERQKPKHREQPYGLQSQESHGES